MAHIKEILAYNIRLLRKKSGLSQEKLAEAAELSAQTISDIEGCRTWVSDKTLESLSKILKVDVFQLFIPPVDASAVNMDLRLYNRLCLLKTAMKEDIDKRLDDFYLSEKSASRN